MKTNMLHKTGIGKIHIDTRDVRGMIRATLYNFDVDGDQLKPEHRIFLQTTIAPLPSASTGTCDAGICKQERVQCA